MAGIGFHLGRIFERETYHTDLATAASAGFAFAGPWICGSLASLALYLHSRDHLAPVDQQILFSLVTYAYAGAMVLTSVLAFPTTRYLADQIYAEALDTIAPTFTAAWILHMVVAVALGGAFAAACPLPPAVRILAILILVATTQIWLAGTFVNMLRSYLPVTFSFLGGYAAAVACAMVLGERLGLEGYLAGYWIGLAVVALSLTAYLLLSFPCPRPMDFKFLRDLWKNRMLAVVGFTLAAGVWVDELVLWSGSPMAVRPIPQLATLPPYDVAFTIGALATLPGLAWVLLGVETAFAQVARHIFTSLSEHQPHAMIEKGKHELVDVLKELYWGFVKKQAPVTLLLVVFARQLLEALSLPDHMVHVTRFALLAAPAVLLLQAHSLYVLYFDQPETAAVSTVTFFVGNLVLAKVSLERGYASFGLGSVLAGYFAVWVGGLAINRTLARLEQRVLVGSARSSFSRAR
jgi:uncharacterized membrane protein